MEADGNEPAVWVDASGLCCPLPLVELAKRARTLEPGRVVALRATDAAIRHDLPAWCEATGHALLEVTEADGAWVGRVRLR